MKFKPEKFITQRVQKSGLYTFYVRIRTEESDISKSFNERDYLSARLAYESAIQFRDKTLYEIRNKVFLQQNSATVQEMFDKYLETTTDSFKTKRKYTYLFDKYILHKSTKIQDLTRADIQTDLNKMVEECSDDTIGKVFSIWRKIINIAVLNEILNKDVTLGVKKPASKKLYVKKDNKTDRKTLTEVEHSIIKHTPDKYNARIIIFLLEVLYYTGMRPAEALALTRKDITKNGISITKEIGSSMDDTGVVRRTKTKDSVRVVPIHPELRPILKDLMEYAKCDELFKNSDRKYMESDWIGCKIYRACKIDGIEFNMYRLRHNMATQLVTNNVDSKTTVELLGHANYDMSIYYASSNDELKEDAILYIH